MKKLTDIDMSILKALAMWSKWFITSEGRKQIGQRVAVSVKYRIAAVLASLRGASLRRSDGSLRHHHRRVPRNGLRDRLNFIDGQGRIAVFDVDRPDRVRKRFFGNSATPKTACQAGQPGIARAFHDRPVVRR